MLYVVTDIHYFLQQNNQSLMNRPHKIPTLLYLLLNPHFLSRAIDIVCHHKRTNEVACSSINILLSATNIQ